MLSSWIKILRLLFSVYHTPEVSRGYKLDPVFWAYVQTDCTQANKSFVTSVSLLVIVRILYQSSPANVADVTRGTGKVRIWEGAFNAYQNVAKSDHTSQRNTALKTVKIIIVNCGSIKKWIWKQYRFRALHRHRRGHGSKSRKGLILFSGLFSTTAKIVFITEIAFIFITFYC